MDYIDRIDLATEKFNSSFEGLNEKELNWKPNPETWSIGQNLDHIITINESYYPSFEAIHKGNLKLSFLSKFGFIADWFGSMILKSVDPRREKKVKTFSIWEPSHSTLTGDILQRFINHQKELKSKVLELKTEIHTGVVIASPASKHIVYKLDKAIEIIITHELRHYNQAMEVLGEMGK